MAESSAGVDRLAVLQLSGRRFVGDPLDLVSYEYELRESESGEECTIHGEQTTFEQMRYQFGCWGQYELVITAFDGVHEVARTISLDVLPLPAELEPISDVQMAQGQSLSIPLSVRNLREDGPFSYSIVQGPAGLSVSPEGLLQGEPVPMIRESESSFNVTVQADNGRQSFSTFAIRYHSAPGDVSLVPASAQYCASQWLKTNQTARLTRVCPTNGSYVVERIESNQVQTVYAASSQYSSAELLAADLIDVNRDAIAEIVLIYKDRVAIVGFDSHQLLGEIDYPTAYSAQAVVNYIQQSGRVRRPVALLATDTQLRLIDLSNGTVTDIQSTGEIKLFGDVDSDQNVEIVRADGVVLEPVAGSAWQLQPAVNNEKFMLLDLDGNGTDDLLRMVDNSQGGLVGPVSFRIAFGADRTVLQSAELGAPDGNNDNWSPRIVVADGAAGVELIARQPYSLDAYAYGWDESGFELIDSFGLPEAFANFDSLSAYPISGGLLISSSDRLFIKGSGGDEFLAVDDQRSGLLAADQAGLFAESDGSHTMFVSRFSQNQRVTLDGLGRVQDVNQVASAVDFGASQITRHNDAYVAAVPRSRWQTVIGEDGRRYTERHYYYGVFDVLSNTAIEEVEVPFMLEGNISSADIDLDGVLDLFVPRMSTSNCSGWYVAGIATPRQTLLCTGGASGALVADIKTIDLDGDGTKEVIQLNRLLLGGFDLQVYRLNGGRLQNWFGRTRSEYGSLAEPFVGVQDVDADGVLEIVVAERGAMTTRLSVLEQTGVTREFTVSTLLHVLPDVTHRRPNASIVAIRNTDTAVKSTQFLEIGGLDGKLIWASQRYQGVSAKNGLHFLNRDGDSSVVVAVTSAGIYRFE